MKHALTVKDLWSVRSNAFHLKIERLQIKPGTILCIAGPNGSGKTTFLECIVGLLKPQAGTVRVLGHRVDKHLQATKSLIGFMPDDEAWFIKELCAREYFQLLKTVYAEAGNAIENMDERIERLAALLFFTAFDQPLERLSHGNKKKVQLIAGLMHSPKLVIVDELRNGLDPLAIIAAEKIIKEETARGACIIAATHDLWWAERIADETLLLIDGRIALHQPTAKLIAIYGSLEQLFIQTVNQRLQKDAAV